MALRGALGFLTALPLRGDAGRGAPWFPLIGAALGLAGGSLFLAAAQVAPAGVAAALVLAFWAAAGGARHERAFADACGGGLRGALALAVSILGRGQALLAVPWHEPAAALCAVAAAQAAARAATVALGWITNPVGDGPGRGFALGLTPARALTALSLTAIVVLAADPRRGLWMLAAGYGTVLAARWFFHRLRGGVDAPALFAAGHLAEILALGVAAAGR